MGGAFLAPYQATKHAVVAISESLYGELALEPADVTASCLCPGDVATGIWDSGRLLPKEERYELGSEAEQAFHDQVSGGVADGITPEELAKRTFEGIDAGRFWILPQPAFKPLYELRVEKLLKEEQPVTFGDSMGFETR